MGFGREALLQLCDQFTNICLQFEQLRFVIQSEFFHKGVNGAASRICTLGAFICILSNHKNIKESVLYGLVKAPAIV